MKRRVLLSLSNTQKENAVASLLTQIQTVNSNIDKRCATGEEVPERDEAMMKVRKMRSMLAVIATA